MYYIANLFTLALISVVDYVILLRDCHLTRLYQ